MLNATETHSASMRSVQGKTITNSNAEYRNSIWEIMNKLSDAMGVVDVAAQNEESLHGSFCRALSKLLDDVYSDIENLYNSMEGGAA